MRRLIIVNADDLGMSQHVNDAIFALMAEGCVSSSTMMANGPAIADAAARVKTAPNRSFGVHLNLTQFEPLTGGGGARLLVSADGVMTRAIERATPSPARLRAMYEELCAQVDRIAGLGVSISHLDSHNHVHTRPQLFPVIKALQKRYAIRTVRISKNLYAPDDPCPPSRLWAKRAFNAALRHVFRTRTTDAFTELTTFAAIGGRYPAARTIELMVHPGASYAAKETEILRSDWVSTLPDTELIPYDRLPRQA